MIFKTTTSSPAATCALGVHLGRKLRGGEVIELASDLGGGKTLMVKGIAEGLGYKGEVTSPTFTISRIYRLPKGLELHHFDFYRIEAGDIVTQELAEVLNDPAVIVAIEWAGHAGDVLPSKRIKITIDPLDENHRDITIATLDPSLNHALEGLNG